MAPPVLKPYIPRTSSAIRFDAIHSELDKVLDKMRVKLKDRCALGRLDVSEEELETIARMARVFAYDATARAYEQGKRDGRLRARIELGEPADENNSPGVILPGSEQMVLCPTCKRVVAK